MSSPPTAPRATPPADNLRPAARRQTGRPAGADEDEDEDDDGGGGDDEDEEAGAVASAAGGGVAGGAAEGRGREQ